MLLMIISLLDRYLLARTQFMPSSSSSSHRHGRALLLLAVVASLSTTVTSQDSNNDNPFTSVDCQSPSPSPAPSPSPTSSSANSTFRSNVVALLDDLPSAAAPAGFASLSRGSGSDRAFVRGICRGDSAPGDCAAYLRTAASGIISRCNSSSRRAGIWHDKCFISYADTNASTDKELQFRSILYNSGKVGDEDAFENTYYALMRGLAERLVNGSGPGGGAAPMFAVGKAVYDPAAPNGTMHGLLQCMRDRTAAECNRCLQESIPALPSCCYGHQGGVVLGYNCNLRVEIYTYYDLALDAPPPGRPAPPPSSFVGERRDNNNNTKEGGIRYVEPEQLNVAMLRAATNNFSEENKLGEGGFGEVFKGVLQDGEEIAVKRLSQNSSQGFHELKNELVLAAKLKHRNLVQLLGVCLQEEKLLIYEYMPNRSLDTFLFDQVRRQQLDWSRRFAIICGIARGLLYLHEESRLKVIHRDLKPSNVLLDADMNPKISDFGLARAFGGDQSRDITRRPVGTLGYMSPEYAYWGHVSTKSDMFSFGVIVLEMVTGRRNNSAYSDTSDSVSVLSLVWDKWRAGSTGDVVDPSLAESQYPESEVLNCIEIGLLCPGEPGRSPRCLHGGSYAQQPDLHV
ncbi:hypothetical protein PVAP13_6NG246300 [Panicum virgatum]|uniref:Uncharacterized protein n=1 Tax=Panicum virgatum TaxID=38727 RepID=A0A8T0QXJ8_PANVG|nr:hypothetical protein PVAP13_6NG246300 [Panicum virgatum]